MHYHVSDGITDPGFETLNQAVHYMAARLVDAGLVNDDDERNHRSAIRRLVHYEGLHQYRGRTVSLDLPNFEELIIRSCETDEHLILFDLQSLGFEV
jgi:hypothetical protein